MGRKRAGVLGDAQSADSARACSRLRLLDEARARNHYGRNAEDFRRDAGARLLRRAESAAAVARNHRVHLELPELALELVLLAADDARAWIRPGRTDLVQQVDFRRRKFLQNEVLEFAVRDGRHEASADEGDRLPRERPEARTLLHRLHGSLRNRRKNGELDLCGRGGKRTYPVLAGFLRGKGGRERGNANS